MTLSRSATLAALLGLSALPFDANADSALSSGAEVPAHLSALEGILFYDLSPGRTFSFSARPDTHTGWYGNAGIVANAANGDVDEFYGGVAGRFGYFDGVNSHDFVLGYAYDEDGDLAATNIGSISYQYRHSFTDRFFAFGHLEGRYNEFGSYENDDRAVAGIGYRVINSTRASLSLLAGPGYRHAERSDGRDFDEAGLSLGTRGYFALSDKVYATGINTVMVSESDTIFTSDLSLNVALSDLLSLRAGFQKEYHTNPGFDRDDTVNIFSASLVYTFN